MFSMQILMKILKYIITAVLFSTICAYAEEINVNDSTKQERFPDSLLSIPLYNHGKTLKSNYQPYRVINKKDIQLINYVSINDIISNFTPFYNQHLGSYSSYNSFLAMGADSRSISWSFNGRTINDLDLGSLNPEQFSTEFFENIEIFTGADAVILGDNAASVLVNFQEIRYNTALPFTRIWFGNSGYGYLGADVVYSQNIMPNWNFTFGFRSYNSTGAYENAWGNNWNARAILRWNPDNFTSISLSENFSNIGSGTSGGINTELSENIFDVIGAIPNFMGLNERTLRHDLTITATRLFDTVMTHSASINLYLSSVRWDRSSGSNLQFDVADTSRSIYKNSYDYFGVEGKYELQPLEAITLRLGGYSELNLIDKSHFYSDFNGVSSAVYAHSTINFSDNFNLSGGLRLSSRFGNVGISYGVKQSTRISDNIAFEADFSYADRLPYLVEGLSLDNEQHLALNGELQIQTSERTKLHFGAFFRTIFSPIEGAINEDLSELAFLIHFNGNNITRSGIYADYTTNVFDNFTVRLRGLGQLSVDADGNRLSELPLFSGSFRAFYTYKPGKSMLRAGLETGLLTDFKGEQFFPLTRTFYNGSYNSGIMLTGVTAFLEVKLGDAYVKIQFANLLSQNYFYSSVYPMFPGNLRLSVNWTFNED